MKNEKFLLDIQTKGGDIAKEIPNAAIDAEKTFKCKWSYVSDQHIISNFCIALGIVQ